jgi:hypothetical protein
MHCSTVNEKAFVALGPRPGAREYSLILLDGAGSIVRRWDLGENLTGSVPAISPQAGLVAILAYRIGAQSRKPTDLMLFDLEGDAPPQVLALEWPGGFQRSLSPNGGRLAFWLGSYAGVADLNARRVQWQRRLERPRPRNRFGGIQCDEHGCAVAVMANPEKPAPMEVCYFDSSGDHTLLWKSDREVKYKYPRKGTPLVVDWEARLALVQFGNEILALPLPPHSQGAR